MTEKKYSLVTANETLLIEREVQRLLTAFVHKIDDGKFGEAAELFLHGEYEVEGSKFVGRDAVESFLNGLVQPHHDGVRRTWHSITNIAVEIDPLGDSASSVSYYTVHQQLEGHPFELVRAGRWHDTFELFSGDWRFKSRVSELRMSGLAGLPSV
ncbi:nuclear transport factor 2 family protein [Pseudomonas sp. UBA1879]|uniref:nuclear transport factor 2 family protein n=1 Tax=Pseudomonas sp. UBA1879 TaxID=1947305 RepID=UPI0025FAA23D|nr:nuclear transport factor 2 family protein [Pseudomonas sp. UBA1879]